MYVIDTNIFLDWWERRYPPDVFPSVQRHMEGLVSAQKMCAPERVHEELKHVGSKSLQSWAKNTSICSFHMTFKSNKKPQTS